jgi:type II secretory pathway pseudopilin PulG
MANPSPNSDVKARVPPQHYVFGQTGLAYIGLLILVAVVGMAAAATVQSGAISQRRAAEQELLYLGTQFVAALRSYSARTPAGRPQFPRELTDLLRDPRTPHLHRHLRTIPIDPLTGASNWGVVRSPDGYFVAVHSLSDAMTIKSANFDQELAALEGKSRYSDWIFSAAPMLRAPNSSAQ